MSIGIYSYLIAKVDAKDCFKRVKKIIEIPKKDKHGNAYFEEKEEEIVSVGNKIIGIKNDGLYYLEKEYGIDYFYYYDNEKPVFFYIKLGGDYKSRDIILEEIDIPTIQKKFEDAIANFGKIGIAKDKVKLAVFGYLD